MIKVAISSHGRDLYSPMDPDFDGCGYFLIVNPENLNFETVPNVGVRWNGRSGINAAQMVFSKGVEAVITGGCGPGASRTLSAAGIRTIFKSAGSVLEAVKDFWRGEYHTMENHVSAEGLPVSAKRSLNRAHGARRV